MIGNRVLFRFERVRSWMIDSMKGGGVESSGRSCFAPQPSLRRMKSDI